jgi:hypothetical protein
MVVFTLISKSGAISSTHFFSRLKLQNFTTMICNVASKNLKIDPQNENGILSSTPFFRGFKITSRLKS